MEVHLTVDSDRKRWNEFVLQYSDHPLFLYEGKEIIEHGCGYRCLYLMAEDRKDIAGVFPTALIRSKLFGTRLCSLPFSDYGGPLFSSGKNNSFLLKSFLNYLSSYTKQVDYFEVRSPIQPQVRICLKNVFEEGYVKYVAFLIDLNKSFDEIWQHAFDKYLRNAIRKAIKNKIEVLEVDLGKYLSQFYGQYLMTMKKLGSPPHGMEYFRICHDLLGDKRVKLFVAMMSSKVVGGVITFLGRYTMYPGYEGIDPKYRNLNPASLLFSRIIEWGCENKYKSFDFGRTLYGSGVYHFKKQWGGREKISPYYYLGKKIPQRDPRKKYSQLSKLWSKFVPLSTTKKIGPPIKRAIGY